MQVTHDVATVIHNDVWNADLVDHALEKSCVLLSTNMDFDLIFGELLAFGIDVDTNDSSVWAKILLPHLQRTTQPAADFNEGDRLVDELIKMPLVNWEIVLPFMYQSLIVVEGIRPESHKVSVGFQKSNATGKNRASMATHRRKNEAAEILSFFTI